MRGRARNIGIFFMSFMSLGLSKPLLDALAAKDGCSCGRRARMCVARGCRAAHAEGGQWQSHGPLLGVPIRRRGTRADGCGGRGIGHLDFRAWPSPPQRHRDLPRRAGGRRLARCDHEQRPARTPRCMRSPTRWRRGRRERSWRPTRATWRPAARRASRDALLDRLMLDERRVAAIAARCATSPRCPTPSAR